MGAESKETSKLTLLLSSLKMALATMISRLLGLVREQVIAFYFGASGVTDAFYIAYRIPNLLRDLFAEGAFSAAFVPEFTGENQKGLERANDLLWKLFMALAMVTGLISALTFIFAPQVVHLFAPSYGTETEQFMLTVNLVKIMAPFLLFVSLAALIMGALNSLKVFFLPSLAPATFNISMIASMVIGINWLRDEGMPGIYALGVGVFLGGIVQGLFQLPKLYEKGFRMKILNPTKVWKDPRVQKVFIKLGPGLVGFAATQINLVVTTALASGAGLGAVSWLTFGFRIFQLPVGVLGVSVANSNMVHFSSSWKTGNFADAKKVLKDSFALSLLALIPAAIVLAGLSDLAVKILFERGKFDALDTQNTAVALRYYLLGLPFYGIYKLLVPVFYTLDRQKVPVYCSIFSIIANIIFCVSLVDAWGYKVLALGTTLSMILNSGLQFLILKKELQLPWGIAFNLKNLKTILAGSACFLSIVFSNLLPLNFGDSLFGLSLTLVLKAFICIGIYFLGLALMGERQVLRSVVDKFRASR